MNLILLYYFLDFFYCYLFASGPEHLFELVLLCAVGPRNDTSLLVNHSAWTRPLVLSTSSLMLKWCFCSQLFTCFHSCLFICVNDDGVKSESSFFCCCCFVPVGQEQSHPLPVLHWPIPGPHQWVWPLIRTSDFTVVYDIFNFHPSLFAVFLSYPCPY